MKKMGKFIWIIPVVMIFAGVLAGCGGASKAQLKVYNWGDYIDESVIEEFEEKYNIDVIYDTFATNEEMYVKIKGGGSDYDIAFPSDYMIERMIRKTCWKRLILTTYPITNTLTIVSKILHTTRTMSIPYPTCGVPWG